MREKERKEGVKTLAINQAAPSSPLFSLVVSILCLWEQQICLPSFAREITKLPRQFGAFLAKEERAHFDVVDDALEARFHVSRTFMDTIVQYVL